MARMKQFTKAELLADQRFDLAEYAAKALVAASSQFGIKANTAEHFPLDIKERATVADLPAVAAKFKKKLMTARNFTVAEVAGMVLAVVEGFADAEPKQQVVLLFVAKKLTDCLQANIVKSGPESKAKSASAADIKTKELEFPFQHPAAAEAGFIFHSLCRKVHSDLDYRAMARRDQFLWDITYFENEVMNGGVDQFLYNSGGDHAAECLKALETIQANQSLDLLKQACALLPKGHPSTNQGIRQKQLLAINGDDLHIDDMIDGEIEVNLYQLLLDYYHKTGSKKTK